MAPASMALAPTGYCWRSDRRTNRLRACPGFGIVTAPGIACGSVQSDGYVYSPGAGAPTGAPPRVSQRPDRRPMARAGALVARTRSRGPGSAAHRPVARDRQRAVVHQTDRLSVALSAARSAAPLHGALLLRAVDGRRDARRSAAATP